MALCHPRGIKIKGSHSFPKTMEEWLNEPSTKINALVELVTKYLAENQAVDQWISGGSIPELKPTRKTFVWNSEDGSDGELGDAKIPLPPPRAGAPLKEKIVVYCHFLDMATVIQNVSNSVMHLIYIRTDSLIIQPALQALWHRRADPQRPLEDRQARRAPPALPERG
jgi:hypothetical protein